MNGDGYGGAPSGYGGAPYTSIPTGRAGLDIPGVLGTVYDTFCRFYPQNVVCGGSGNGTSYQTPQNGSRGQTNGSGQVQVQPAAGVCVSGYHLNKGTYWTQSGGVVFKGTRCVKNRRMNPANPRALARAIRRGDAFVRMAKAFGMSAPKAGLKRKKCR